MEVVINKQFGGFRLSHKALMKIYELKEIKVFPYFQDMNYEDCKNYEYVFSKVPCNYNTPLNEFGRSIWYLKNDPKFQSFSIACDGTLPETIDDEYVFGEAIRDTDVDRIDKDVIKVIKELGVEANTNVSDLEIVEIPDDYEFSIHDYDGLETLYAGKDLLTI